MTTYMNGSALNSGPVLCNDCSKLPSRNLQSSGPDKRCQSLNDLRQSKYDCYDETERTNTEKIFNLHKSKGSNQFSSWRSNPPLSGLDGLYHGDSLNDNISSHHSLRDLSMITDPRYNLAEGLPNSRALPSIPHLPRPGKAKLMFEAVKCGLISYIDLSEKRWLDLQRNVDSHSALLKEIIIQKTFIDRLKNRLKIVETLQEDYEHVLNLREKARVKHGEPSRVSDVSEVLMRRPNNDRNRNGERIRRDFSKLNYKSLCSVLCSIEAQLEYLSGTLKCEVAGLSGFARLCPESQFEIKFTYGMDTCKWQCKGRINKDGTQQWEKNNAAHVLSPTIADSLNIKAMEVKTFGIRTLLGKKCCEIRDLISGERRVLSVWINNIGTLKLSIVAEWCPLADCIDDRLLFYNPFDETSKELPLNATSRSNYRYSAPPDVLDQKLICCTENELMKNSISSDCLQHITEEDQPTPASPPTCSPQKIANLSENKATSPVESLEEDPASENSSEDQTHLSTLTLLKNVQQSSESILDSLDDLRGQYRELSELERTLIQLETWSREQIVIAKEQKIESLNHEASGSSSTSADPSNAAAAVESALNAFDFLDETAMEDNTSNDVSAGDNTPYCNVNSSLPQPIKTKSGAILASQELLEVMNDHLSACKRLMSVLTGANLLKTKELRAVEAFEVQNEYINTCLSHVKEAVSFSVENCLSRYLHGCTEKTIWINAKSFGNLYFAYINDLNSEMSSVYKELGNNPFKEAILKKFTEQLLDVDFHPLANRVSLFQFSRFCLDGSLDQRIKDIIGETVTEHQLSVTQSSNSLLNNLSKLERIPYSCWSRVCLLLSHSSDKVRDKARLTIEHFASQRSSPSDTETDHQAEFADLIGRPAALVAMVEGLESDDLHIRAACCSGLQIIQGQEAVNELVNLALNDPVAGVREAAKETIHKLGNSALDVFQNAQLSKHGFQGLSLQSK